MSGLDFLGLLPLSLSDFPGRTAATIFTAGCPLACPYCHNPELTKALHPGSFLPRGRVMDFLASRAGLLEGVAITGGEPSLHAGLAGLCSDIAALGYPIKLDTAGILPQSLRRLLNHPGLAYVALDLKTAPALYSRVGGTPASGARVLESLKLLRAWKQANPRVVYEIRTVCAPGVVDEGVLTALRDLLLPEEPWTLTRFKPGGCLDPGIETLPRVEEELIRRFEAERES
ncbi:anaerobic ribonucleoside-triphosphate reductase activating protein [Spirochaeta lutea]|uniref:anaerobic ribonucleoside-triphosphate reductase activating protein n=1 Tax=Spirochaeta lutea TaxID=1480694 RepID=UPI00068CC51A|nr:anaerobic ribonucleoside-triphosphate reductase activating protein [Spirochaeta lutea]